MREKIEAALAAVEAEFRSGGGQGGALGMVRVKLKAALGFLAKHEAAAAGNVVDGPPIEPHGSEDDG